MKKRFYQIFVLLFVLIWLVCSCSMFGNDDSLSDPFFDDETELSDDEEDLDDDEDEAEPVDPDPEGEEEPVPEPTAELLSGTVLSETEIVFEFSTPITLLSLSFDPYMEVIDLVEDGSMVTVFLEDELEPGLRFMVELEVEDEWENFISKQVPLVSINERFPELLINELRTEYSSSPYRAEFIEFKIQSDGNMGGLRVFVASNNREPMIYQFAPLEVEEGEYVVLHLRTPASGITDTLFGHNFWISGSNKLLRKTDAIYVMDQDDCVLAAVMISEHPGPSWATVQLATAAEFLFDQGAWESPVGGIGTPSDAVSSADIRTSTTRSISRDETVDNTRTPADWYVTANSGATPGEPNDPRRFN